MCARSIGLIITIEINQYIPLTITPTNFLFYLYFRCFEPQGRQGEDRQGFPDRRAEDCRQGPQEPGKVNN